MVSAQTEGDTGYDYNDAYDDEYSDESGQISHRKSYTVKNIRICGTALRYYVDLRKQTYTEPVPLKYGILASKYP